jgi:hypothetical protein
MERISLLNLMRPQISWRLRQQIDRHFRLTEHTGEMAAMIERNEEDLKALGVAPLVSPEAVEGFAPLPQAAKVHGHYRENQRRLRQRKRLASSLRARPVGKPPP